jgi:hypothetical protein
MASGTIVPGTPRQDGTYAYVSVLVAEGGRLGNVEYPGQTALVKVDGSAKTNAELKADLIASVKATRDAAIGAAIQAVANVLGAVVI